MNRNAAYCYGISAASMACLIQSTGDLTFWDERQVTGCLLGAAVPLCVIAGWIIENPFNARHYGFYKVCAFLGVVTGLIGLSLYIFTMNRWAGMGFLVGTTMACFLTTALPDKVMDGREVDRPEENDPPE